MWRAAVNARSRHHPSTSADRARQPDKHAAARARKTATEKAIDRERGHQAVDLNPHDATHDVPEWNGWEPGTLSETHFGSLFTVEADIAHLKPVLLHQRTHRSDGRWKRYAAAMANAVTARGQRVWTLLLCLRRVAAFLPRDVRRYLCAWIQRERFVALGGIFVHRPADHSAGRHKMVASKAILPPARRNYFLYYNEDDLDEFVRPATRVVSFDPLVEGSAHVLPPMPTPLQHLRVAYHARKSELWCFGLPLSVHEPIPQGRNTSVPVAWVLNLQRRKWRKGKLPFDPLPTSGVAVWRDYLVVVNAAGDGRDWCTSLVHEHVFQLPARYDAAVLAHVRPLLVGNLLFVLASTKYCVGMCECCYYPYRHLAAGHCCSSLQVLDLEHPQRGWLCMPVPAALHLCSSALSSFVFEHTGSVLVLGGSYQTYGMEQPQRGMYSLDVACIFSSLVLPPTWVEDDAEKTFSRLRAVTIGPELVPLLKLPSASAARGMCLVGVVALPLTLKPMDLEYCDPPSLHVWLNNQAVWQLDKPTDKGTWASPTIVLIDQ